MKGSRVRISIEPDSGEAVAPESGGRSGVVERVDGAVVWVRWAGERQATPYLAGQLEKIAEKVEKVVQ